MSDRAAFVAAIEAEPENDLPRLVWADWLDDHGEPQRAELIRVQCELARSSSAQLRSRERAALNALERVWPTELAGHRPFTAPHRLGLRQYFERGCLTFLQFHTGTGRRTFATQVRPFVGREPLLDLNLSIGQGTGRRLAAEPLLRLVSSLDYGRPWLLRSRHLTGLRRLWDCRPADLRVLATTPAGQALTDLIVNHWWFLNEVGVSAVETAALLADTPRFAGLRELAVSAEDGWEEATRMLIASPHLSPTLRLVWCGHWKLDRRIARLLRARFPGPPPPAS